MIKTISKFLITKFSQPVPVADTLRSRPAIPVNPVVGNAASSSGGVSEIFIAPRFIAEADTSAAIIFFGNVIPPSGSPLGTSEILNNIFVRTKDNLCIFPMPDARPRQFLDLINQTASLDDRNTTRIVWGTPINGTMSRRVAWVAQHPSFAIGNENRMLCEVFDNVLDAFGNITEINGVVQATKIAEYQHIIDTTAEAANDGDFTLTGSHSYSIRPMSPLPPDLNYYGSSGRAFSSIPYRVSPSTSPWLTVDVATETLIGTDYSYDIQTATTGGTPAGFYDLRASCQNSVNIDASPLFIGGFLIYPPAPPGFTPVSPNLSQSAITRTYPQFGGQTSDVGAYRWQQRVIGTGGGQWNPADPTSIRYNIFFYSSSQDFSRPFSTTDPNYPTDISLMPPNLYGAEWTNIFLPSTLAGEYYHNQQATYRTIGLEHFDDGTELGETVWILRKTVGSHSSLLYKYDLQFRVQKGLGNYENQPGYLYQTEGSPYAAQGVRVLVNGNIVYDDMPDGIPSISREPTTPSNFPSFGGVASPTGVTFTNTFRGFFAGPKVDRAGGVTITPWCDTADFREFALARPGGNFWLVLYTRTRTDNFYTNFYVVSRDQSIPWTPPIINGQGRFDRLQISQAGNKLYIFGIVTPTTTENTFPFGPPGAGSTDVPPGPNRQRP